MVCPEYGEKCLDFIGQKKTALFGRLSFSAESEGFEPPDLLQSTVFKTAAFDHSASSPGAKVQTLINFANFD